MTFEFKITTTKPDFSIPVSCKKYESEYDYHFKLLNLNRQELGALHARKKGDFLELVSVSNDSLTNTGLKVAGVGHFLLEQLKAISPNIRLSSRVSDLPYYWSEGFAFDPRLVPDSIYIEMNRAVLERGFNDIEFEIFARRQLRRNTIPMHLPEFFELNSHRVFVVHEIYRTDQKIQMFNSKYQPIGHLHGTSKNGEFEVASIRNSSKDSKEVSYVKEVGSNLMSRVVQDHRKIKMDSSIPAIGFYWSLGYRFSSVDEKVTSQMKQLLIQANKEQKRVNTESLRKYGKNGTIEMYYLPKDENFIATVVLEDLSLMPTRIHETVLEYLA